MLKTKKAFSAVLALALLAASFGLVVNAQTLSSGGNLVANPGFETSEIGHLGSWHASYAVSNDYAHSGGQSLKVVTDSADPSYASVSFKITPNEARGYKFSIWYRLADDYPYVGKGGLAQHSFLLIYNHENDDGQSHALATTAGLVADKQWHEFKGEFIIPDVLKGKTVGKITRFSLMINGATVAGTGGTIYLDDVSFEVDEAWPEPTLPPIESNKFTVAIIPDTQNEVVSPTQIGGGWTYNRSKWLADNAQSLNLKFVLHTGDMMNWPGWEILSQGTDVQFTIASEGMAVLDNANIPYLVALGNHDSCATRGDGNGWTDNPMGMSVHDLLRHTVHYNEYFPTERFPGIYQFESGKSDNSYRLFEGGGKKWLSMALEFCPRTAVIEWAKEVVESHADYNVLIATHYYLDSGGSIGQSNSGYGDNSPQYLYDNLIKLYPNIKFVFSGHTGNAAKREDTGVNGNKIVSILGTFHSNTTNPVQLLEIDADAGTAKNRYYGPINKTNVHAGWSFTGLDFVESDSPLPTPTAAPTPTPTPTPTAAPAGWVNLIPNSGFETSETDHITSWRATHTISGDYAHTGDYSLKIETEKEDSEFASVSFHVTPNDAKEYRFSFWYRAADDYPYVGTGEFSQHRLLMTYYHENDGGQAHVVAFSDWFVTDGQWHLFQTDFTIPDVLDDVQVGKVYKFTLIDNGDVVKGTGGTFYLDDVVFEANMPPQLTPKNYAGIYNGNPHKPEYIDENELEPGDTLWYSTDGGNDWLSEKPEFTEIGVYTVHVKATNPEFPDRVVEVTVTISQEGLTIVVNNGSPGGMLADASVKLISSGGDEIDLIAGENGFSSVVPPGAYTVEIARPGYLARSFGVNIDEGGSPDRDLSNIELIAGDVNNDGVIDALDFSAFALVFGKTLENAPEEYTLFADFNGDGVIDALDFSDFALGFGKTTAAYGD